MSPEDVPTEWVEKAADKLEDRFYWSSTITSTEWKAAAATVLAAVLPLHETGLLEALRLIDGEMDEADDFDGLNADAVQRIGWYIDPVRARLRAAETESEGRPS